MPEHESPAVRLNNFLQAKQQVSAIQWSFQDTGPQNSKTWHAEVTYGDKVVGKASASHKVDAKNEAATQALSYLQKNMK